MLLPQLQQLPVVLPLLLPLLLQLPRCYCYCRCRSGLGRFGGARC
jgi:hypothetical protein